MLAVRLGGGNVLNPDKLGFQYGFAIFQKHCNNIVQVVVDFIQRFALGMSAGKTRNKANEQASLWAPLNYRRIDFHGWLQNCVENSFYALR